MVFVCLLLLNTFVFRTGLHLSRCFEIFLLCIMDLMHGVGPKLADEASLLFPTCFWFLERPLCVFAQGLNEPICWQIIIIIIRQSVDGSRAHRFSFYLMKMWWCSVTGFKALMLMSTQRGPSGALGSAWLLQWLVFVKALKDSPVPHVSRRFFLSICLFCHNWALFAAGVEHRYHQNSLYWFLAQVKMSQVHWTRFMLCQFSKFSVGYFTTSVRILMFDVF